MAVFTSRILFSTNRQPREIDPPVELTGADQNAATQNMHHVYSRIGAQNGASAIGLYADGRLIVGFPINFGNRSFI